MPIFTLLIMAAMVLALVDIILRQDGEVKHLPKWAWVILVILVPLIGTVLWFALGREWPERQPRAARPPQFAPWASAPPAPAAPAARTGMADTRSTEQQLADLEKEIEEERLRAELRRQRSERGEV